MRAVLGIDDPHTTVLAIEGSIVTTHSCQPNTKAKSYLFLLVCYSLHTDEKLCTEL